MLNPIAAFRWSSTCHCIMLLMAILCYYLQNQHVSVVIFGYGTLTSLVRQHVVQNERVHNSYIHSMIKKGFPIPNGATEDIVVRKVLITFINSPHGGIILDHCKRYRYSHFSSFHSAHDGSFAMSKTRSRYNCDNAYVPPTHINSG